VVKVLKADCYQHDDDDGDDDDDDDDDACHK
jgi:hypothetical protein